MSASITDQHLRHAVEPKWVGSVAKRRKRQGSDLANIVIRAQALAVPAAVKRTMIVSSSASFAATVGDSLPG